MKTFLTIQAFIVFVLVPQFVVSQIAAISGFIKNNETQMGLANVAIFEKGSQIGTITNNKGFYRLYLKKGEVHLQVSEPNFQTCIKEINLHNDTIISINLSPENVLHKKGTTNQLKTDISKKEPKSHRKRFLLF